MEPVEEGPPASYPDYGADEQKQKQKQYPKVTNPDGWREFGKAKTKLSPKELEDLMNN